MAGRSGSGQKKEPVPTFAGATARQVWGMPKPDEDAVRGLPVRPSLAQAARALGYTKGGAAKAIENGTWPADIPIIDDVARGRLVEKADLLRHLRLEPAGAAAGPAGEG